MFDRGRIIMFLDNSLEADARVEKEASTLKAQGYTVEIFAVEAKHLPITETRSYGLVRRTISGSIDRPFSKEYKKFRATFVKSMLGQNFKILHCHDYKMLLLGAEIKKNKPEIFLIYDSHEFLSGWPHYKDLKGAWNRFKGWVVWKWFVGWEKEAIKYADEVITVSDSIAGALQKLCTLAKKPVVLRNIPESGELSTEKYFHKKFDLPVNSRVLVHSGGLYHAGSRIKMMLDIVNGFDDLYLVFLGGYEKMIALKEANTNEKIKFHNYVPRHELIPVLSSANFGIVHTWQPEWPSHWFSLPNRIMEYSQAGLAIVSTGQPEFLALGKKYGHIVFYEGNNKEQLKNAIQNAMENESVLRQKALIARKELTWENESQKLVQLYEKIK